MSQAYSTSISMIIIQLYSKILRATWKVLEKAKCTWSLKVFICIICYPAIHLLSVSLKRKNKQHFHNHAAYDYSREYKRRWCVKTLHMTYVADLHNPPIINTCIRNVWRPVNDGFSFFVIILCDIYQQKSWICKHFCEKSFSCRQPTPFCSIEMPFAFFSVVKCRIILEMFSVFLLIGTLSK